MNHEPQELSGGAVAMSKSGLTAVISPAPEGGYWAVCPEIPGANGQGETVEEARRDLAGAVALLVEDHRQEMLAVMPEDAVRVPMLVG